MRDRDLVRLYWPVDLRPAFDALFGIYDAMAVVVGRSTEPTLAAIKLAWWRERLEELDHGVVPAEPRLQAVATELLPRRISGAELAELERGWTSWLADPPVAASSTQMGAYLFRLGARLLNIETNDMILSATGRLFVIVDEARRGINKLAPADPGFDGYIVPPRARPLTALAALAVRDSKRGGPPFEAEGTPFRAWTVLFHRLTGRFPR